MKDSFESVTNQRFLSLIKNNQKIKKLLKNTAHRTIWEFTRLKLEDAVGSNPTERMLMYVNW